jgi:hypothetical protein
MKKLAVGRACAVAVLSAALVNVGVVSSVQAAIIDTDALVASARDADLAKVRAQLSRDEVRAKFTEMGVDASALDARIASLSDQELHRLALEMEKAPAGGDVLAVIGVVFIVLIILEFVGVIDIFKKAP